MQKKNPGPIGQILVELGYGRLRICDREKLLRYCN